MFDLYACNFYNVWLDVKPTNGHRVVIQTSPGGVQSGMDYYQNDAGMVLTETTIGQTKFDPSGESIGSRSRRAMQYGDSIDSVVAILGKAGNGLYTNEWLLADTKTNEIAMYELGTNSSKLYRSSRNEWFGGTEGFYWGCNNTKDQQVRLETIAAVNDRPGKLIFVPADRDRAWVDLYRQYKGKIDEQFAKLAFSTPPLAAHPSCDAKFTTTDLAKEMKSYAAWGNAGGTLWEPTSEEREKFPDVKPLVSNPWTIMTIASPAAAGDDATVAVDLKRDDSADDGKDKDDDDKPQPPPAWHGTILAASDSDVWLASAFAEFHDYAARANQMLQENSKAEKNDKPAKLTGDQCDELAVKLFASRSSALTAARRAGSPIAPREGSIECHRRHVVRSGQRARRIADGGIASTDRRTEVRYRDGRLRPRPRGEGGQDR